MFLERDEMKFAILYTLCKNVEPMTMPVLCDVLTFEKKQVMNYFDLSIMLNELIGDGFAETLFYRDERAFCLTEKGKETNSFFFERVPKSIRNWIDKTVSERKFEEQINPNSVTAEVLPIATHQYMATPNMLDANLPMLELKIHAGGRAQSEKAAKLLKKNADRIYEFLIDIIGE